MFGWFRPRCPVEAGPKAWIEQRLRWLTQEFGLARLQNVPVILPTDEYFPGHYDATEKDGRALVGRVCRYMGIDPGHVQLHFYHDRRPPMPGGLGQERWEGAAGLYQDGSWEQVIQIEVSALQDPLALVATAAHELGHVLLLGQGRISSDTPDHEELTDLLTVFMGLGIFTANSRVRSSATHDGLTETFRIQRLGYLSQPMTGYALAVFAYVRGEHNPGWARLLCVDVRSPLKAGLRYLHKTGNCLFDPGTQAFKSLADEEMSPRASASGPDSSEATAPPLLSDDELPPGFQSPGR